VSGWVRARRTAAEIWWHPANRGRRPQVIARAARYQVLSRMGRGVPTPIGQHSVLLARRGETNSPRHVYATPADWPEMLVWPRYLQPGALFVDVGANVGAYTVLALDCGAQVVAVEPDDRARARLVENVTFNGYRCDIVDAAVGAAPGEMQMTVGLDSYNHLVADGAPPDAATRTVPIRTLDDILAGRTAAGIKIDVEGHELAVLHGAAVSLAEHRIAVMQLEWNHRAREVAGGTRGDVAELLRGHNYQLRRPDQRGILQPVTDPEEGRDVFAVAPGSGW
jgi:FkbM family methyltransferase